MPSFSTKSGVDAVPTVLLTHEYLPFRGGVATYVREVATAATQLGLPVIVWTVNYQGRQGLEPPETELMGKSHVFNELFPVVRLRSNGRLTPWGLLSLAVDLWRRREEWQGRPVVLASVGAQMAFFLLAVLGRFPNTKVTCFFHGSEVLRFQRHKFWRVLSRRFYRRSGLRFAASTAFVRQLLAQSGLLPFGSPIDLAPCALPTVFHVEQRREAEETLPEGDQAADRTFRVLTVARLHPRKGQREVARALALLPNVWKQRVRYQLVGVGDENYRREVERTCRESGVACEFLGAVDDPALARIYARATLYAQASRTLPQSVEGFGLTFLEAGLYGCPAAAWRSGGVNEAVLDGRTGLLVEEGDIDGLARTVERLLADPGLRKQLGVAAQVHARSFRWEDAARVLCSSSG